jgi:hypothetical protein
VNGPDLTEQVHHQFIWLTREYGFIISQVSSGLFKLHRGETELWLACSMDLPSLDYIEKLPSGEADMYSIWDFLARRRGQAVERCLVNTPKSMTIYQTNCLMLKTLSCALRTAGMDIVEGCDSWRKNYPGLPRRLNRCELAFYKTDP